MRTPLRIPPRYLAKYVRDATTLSRRQIREAHAEGRFQLSPRDRPLDANPALGALVFAEDIVTLDGTALTPSKPRHYFALHKPAGVLSTTDDPQNRRCLDEWLARLPEGIFPVGRLDRPTTGLLLFVDDGDLAHMLLHPSHHVSKEYHLTLDERLYRSDPRIDLLRSGVELQQGPPARALSARVVAITADATRLRIEVDEGRKHLVRKMCRCARLRLRHLHRTRMGPTRLAGLEPGEIRELSPDEVTSLWKAVGGREAARRGAVQALRALADRWRAEDRPHRRLEEWLRREASLTEEDDEMAQRDTEA